MQTPAFAPAGTTSSTSAAGGNDASSSGSPLPPASNRLQLVISSPFLFLVVFGVYSVMMSETSVAKLKVHESVNVSATPASLAAVKVVKPTCASPAAYDAVHSAIVDAQSRIWTYWNVPTYPLFLGTMSIPKKSWEIQKLKFVRLLLERGGGSGGGSGSTPYQFVVGFSGSSVTAGHDNYFSEAYPSVFYEALRPVFSALPGGVNLTVRNHALGTSRAPCIPAIPHRLPHRLPHQSRRQQPVLPVRRVRGHAPGRRPGRGHVGAIHELRPRRQAPRVLLARRCRHAQGALPYLPRVLCPTIICDARVVARVRCRR